MITELPEVAAADEQELIRGEEEIDRLVIELHQAFQRAIVPRFHSIPDCSGCGDGSPPSLVAYETRKQMDPIALLEMGKAIVELAKQVYCLGELRGAK